MSGKSSAVHPAGESRPDGRALRLRPAMHGALLGLAVGLLALGGALAVAWKCLPYRISFPPAPWPWVCSAPAYQTLGWLAFPVNLLTDDLRRAILLAPLSLAIYVLLGALLGWVLGGSA